MIINSLGATADEVKEYFDVSVYRNVLDMVNTFEGVLNRWGLDLHDQIINMYSCGSNKSLLGAQNIGFAINAVGQQHGWNEVYVLSRKILTDYNLKPIPPTWNTFAFSNTLNKYNKYYALNNAYFNVEDLLNLARQINWELNRVRLPAPHNFRQVNEKIQGRPYKITPAKLSSPTPFSDSYEEQIPCCANTSNFINLIDLINVYGQLKQAINIIRNSTRKEIDAANLATKVQEETLRREQEELISREEAEVLAEENRLKILAEKKAALEKELMEAEQLQKELTDTRLKLESEAQAIAQLKEQATTEEEVADLDKEITIKVDAIEKVKDVAFAKEQAAKTALIAANNLNTEIKEVAATLEQSDVATPNKKVTITPILLTIAAGVFLS